MIGYEAAGDILATRCEAVVREVNCVGAARDGLSKAAALRWHAQHKAHVADCGLGLSCRGLRDSRIGARAGQVAPSCLEAGCECRTHKVRPGAVIARRTGETRTRLVLDLPVRRHWQNAPALADLSASVASLVSEIRRHALASVAIPRLAGGDAGLDWPAVRSALESALSRERAVEATIYADAPDGWHDGLGGHAARGSAAELERIFGRKDARRSA